MGLLTPDLVDLAEVAERSQRQFPVIVELAERDVTADPLGTLVAIDRARADGLHIAVDNVGLGPASAVLLPLVQPDVLKLDRSLVADAAQLLIDGLGDDIRHSGVHLIAQGIEREEHRSGPGHGSPLRAGLPVRPPPAAAQGHRRAGRAWPGTRPRRTSTQR